MAGGEKPDAVTELVTEPVQDAILLPDDAKVRLRALLGLEASDPVRLAFVPGPGDVVGTYAHWCAGRHDPRVPVIAYSTMFYELVRQLDATAQVVTVHDAAVGSGQEPGPPPDPRITFVTVPRPTGQRRFGGRLGARVGARLADAAYAREVAAAVTRFDPHVAIVSTDLPPAAWSSIAGSGGSGQRQGPRLILTAHNTFWPMGRPPAGLRARARLWALKRHARALSGVISTSHECRRQIEAITDGRVSGGVEHPQVLDRYMPNEGPDEDLATGRPLRRLLYLGRIERSKGVFLLLDAFSALAARHPGLSLVIAGSGRAEAELRDRLAARPVPGTQFVGRLDSAGVHAALEAADLLVCPTTSAFNEGLALVGFEGAAHGVPTLMSSVVPAADLLGAGARVFRADDAGALEDAIETLLADPEALAAMRAALGAVRARLYDRQLSWGSELYRVLAAL